MARSALFRSARICRKRPPERKLQELEFARRERPGASGLLLCAEEPPPEAKFPQGLRAETLSEEGKYKPRIKRIPRIIRVLGGKADEAGHAASSRKVSLPTELCFAVLIAATQPRPRLLHRPWFLKRLGILRCGERRQGVRRGRDRSRRYAWIS